MDGTKPTSLMDKMAINVGLDPNKVEKAKFEGGDFRNKGRESFLAGDYVKAAKYYRKSIEITAKGLCPNHLILIPTYIGLCESYIRLKDWQQAKIIADSLMPIAKKFKHQEAIRVTVELLDEIEQGEIGQTGDKINRDCSSCRKTDAKFHCGLCKSVNYCSRECQRDDWINHKPNCLVKDNIRQIDDKENKSPEDIKEKSNDACSSCNKPGAKFHCGLCKRENYCSKECQRKDWANHKEICRVMSSPRPTCGLCGFEGSRWILITKTLCCGQWICDDIHTYEFNKKKLNSCMINHSANRCSENLAKMISFYSGVSVSNKKCGSQEEIEWEAFCDKHFDFKKVTEKERKRNREMKTDGSTSTGTLMVI